MVPRVIGSITNDPPKNPPLNAETFKAKFNPEFRKFFDDVMRLADDKDFQLYWGTTSFSIRKRFPSLNGYASVIYCWLNGSFSFYFAQLPISNEASEKLRIELLSKGIFKESGKKTLVWTLNKETLDRAKEVVKFILDTVNELAKKSELADSQE